MTLFDGKPLTEAEIAAREMCECGHMRARHCGVHGEFAMRRHDAYHRSDPTSGCGDDCEFDPSVVCAECGCNDFTPGGDATP